jgi:general stress protein 26
MNVTPSPVEERAHFRDLLKRFHTAMLITHSARGRLHARPMAIARVDDDGGVWFLTAGGSAKIHEITMDTQVHIVCQDDRSAYLSMSGRAELRDDAHLIAQLWQEPFRVWFPDGADDPSIELIRVHPAQGEYWDNTGLQKVKYLFEAAKACATGQTPNVAEGEQHGRVVW